MANGMTGLKSSSYGPSVVGPQGLFGSVSDFQKSFSFTPRPEGMGISSQEMQKKAQLLQQQQDKKNFFQEQQDRQNFLDFQRKQEQQAKQQSFLDELAQKNATAKALQGIENLYNSFTIFGQSPDENQKNQLKSYIQQNVASGNFNDDIARTLLRNYTRMIPNF